jgi:hypothetical protein
MNEDMRSRTYQDYRAMQKRRRDGLYWDKGSSILLTSALTLLLFAFVFYDFPIIDNNQLFSYFRDEQPPFSN